MYSVEDEDDFDYLIVFVTVKASKLCLYEVLIKPTRFKVGDGLIFGYVLRRNVFHQTSSQSSAFTGN